MKRLLDILFSLTGIVVLSPLLLYISMRIKMDTTGNIFYKQKRVGKGGKEFFLFKFRTMNAGSDKTDLLTYGTTDARITGFGSFLRRYKLDELPQLFNVLIGDMSIVGPRPEVKKYVDLYTPEQRLILNVKPGITDMASISFFNENELLATQPQPEQYYIEYIMPEKIKLNQVFITSPNVFNYFRIIALTIKKIATH
ncbi:MAG: sugar transferase [Chitinophagaceae bacterium]|nr:sugar transferase [Chitinophagaceae bacterium]MCB9044845.1 sugar transferase [Chitinophagales bacterium]